MSRRVPIFIGWDPAEMRAWNVAATSLRRHSRRWHDVSRLALDELQAKGIYQRPTRMVDGQLWDVISAAPMSTGHAIARFFIPALCGYQGWAVFTDGDVLFRADVDDLLALADPRYAVQAVHQQQPAGEAVKKSGHAQTAYPRKNWSSVMLLNCEHPAHAALTREVLHTWPGRDLHAFRWLPDAAIGALPAAWNYLVGVTTPMPDPVCLAHFTLGTPDLPAHAGDPFADEWRAMARDAGYRLETLEVPA